jgi:alkylation response protein AidB-like acyl-CoA dehydrogenase
MTACRLAADLQPLPGLAAHARRAPSVNREGLRERPRWARVLRIFEGTSEIQRMLVGRAVTGLDVR